MNTVWLRAVLAWMRRKKIEDDIAWAESRTLGELLDQYENGMLSKADLVELLEKYWGEDHE